MSIHGRTRKRVESVPKFGGEGHSQELGALVFKHGWLPLVCSRSLDELGHSLRIV